MNNVRSSPQFPLSYNLHFDAHFVGQSELSSTSSSFKLVEPSLFDGP